MEIYDHITATAERQHGLITAEQAMLLGASPDQVRHWRSRRLLVRYPRSQGVLRVMGSPPTDSQAAMAAVLDAGPGAVLSHLSALAKWDISGFTLQPFHILHPRGSLHRPNRLGIRHSSRSIPPHHIKVLDGIPLTSPTRSLFDAAALVHPGRLERAIDTVWGKRLTTGPMLFDMLDELGTPRRPGMRTMRRLLKARGRAYIPPESNLERRFHHLIESDGQEPMRRQVNLGAEAWLGRTDAYDDAARLIVRIQSDRFHTALIDQDHDDRQAEAMRVSGFRVLDVDETDVWYRGAELVARVWAARQAGRRQHGQPSLVRRHEQAA